MALGRAEIAYCCIGKKTEQNACVKSSHDVPMRVNLESINTGAGASVSNSIANLEDSLYRLMWPTK